jgi:membrane protein required for colicin V production
MTALDLTALDYFVLGLTGFSLIFGLMKGFVRSILGLVVAIAGLFLAATWYQPVVPYVRGWVETDMTARLVAFLSIFVATVFAGLVLGRAFRRFLEKAHLSWIDHLAGGAFGFVRGWLISSVIYVALTAFPVQTEMVAQARLAPYLLKGAEVLTYATSKNLRDQFLDGYHQLQARWEGALKGK